MQDAESLPPRREVPMALFGGFALWMMATLVITARLALLTAQAEGQWESVIDELWKWNFLRQSAIFASLALATAGALELSRRTTGKARGGAQLMVGALVALLGVHAVSAYYVWASSAQRENQELWSWMTRAGSTAWLVVGAGALIAGWQTRAMRWLAAPLLLATLLAHPYDFYSQQIYRLLGASLGGSGAGPLLLRGGLELAWAALLLLALRTSPPLTDGSEGWPRVAKALERASNALYAQLALSVAGAFLVLLIFLDDAPRLAHELSNLWVPLAASLASLVAMSGALGAAGLTAAGAPRRMLYAAAALTIAVAVLSMTKVYLLHGEGNDYLRWMGKTMPLILPVMSFTAVVLLVQGLFRLGELTSELGVQAQAWKSRNAVIFGNAVGLGAPFLANASIIPTWQSQLFWVLVAAIASLIAQSNLALLCRVLATELRQRAELPSAQVLRS